MWSKYEMKLWIYTENKSWKEVRVTLLLGHPGFWKILLSFTIEFDDVIWVFTVSNRLLCYFSPALISDELKLIFSFRSSLGLKMINHFSKAIDLPLNMISQPRHSHYKFLLHVQMIKELIRFVQQIQLLLKKQQAN